MSLPRVMVLACGAPGSTAARDAIDDAMAALGLGLVNVLGLAQATNASAGPRQLCTMTRDGQSAVTFVEDGGRGVIYAIANGARAAEIVADLGARLGRAKKIPPELRAALAAIGEIEEPL